MIFYLFFLVGLAGKMNRVRSYDSFGAYEVNQNGVIPLDPDIYEQELEHHSEVLVRGEIRRTINRWTPYSFEMQWEVVKYRLRNYLGTMQRGIAFTSDDNYYRRLRNQVIVEWYPGASPSSAIPIDSSSSSSDSNPMTES